MVKMVEIADDFFVAPQLDPEDVATVAAQGIRSVINGRPDYEGEDQPAGRLIAAATYDAGLAYRHIPVETKNLSEQDVVAFARALNELPVPVLAFCRSGTTLSDIEPMALLFIQDQLRGSPLLFFSQLLDSLQRDANKLAGVRHKLYGKEVGVGFRALNPGLARGVLHAPDNLQGIADFSENGIYLLESVYLEEIARDRVYEFLFVALPVKIRGATGSMVDPLAMV